MDAASYRSGGHHLQILSVDRCRLLLHFHPVTVPLAGYVIGLAMDYFWQTRTTKTKLDNNTMHAEPPTSRVLNRKITPAAR